MPLAVALLEDGFRHAERCALLFFSYVAKSRADPGEDLMLLKAKSLGDPDFANYPRVVHGRARWDMGGQQSCRLCWSYECS